MSVEKSQSAPGKGKEKETTPKRFYLQIGHYSDENGESSYNVFESLSQDEAFRRLKEMHTLSVGYIDSRRKKLALNIKLMRERFASKGVTYAILCAPMTPTQFIAEYYNAPGKKSTTPKLLGGAYGTFQGTGRESDSPLSEKALGSEDKALIGVHGKQAACDNTFGLVVEAEDKTVLQEFGLHQNKLMTDVVALKAALPENIKVVYFISMATNGKGFVEKIQQEVAARQEHSPMAPIRFLSKIWTEAMEGGQSLSMDKKPAKKPAAAIIFTPLTFHQFAQSWGSAPASPSKKKVASSPTASPRPKVHAGKSSPIHLPSRFCVPPPWDLDIKDKSASIFVKNPWFEMNISEAEELVHAVRKHISRHTDEIFCYVDASRIEPRDYQEVINTIKARCNAKGDRYIIVFSRMGLSFEQFAKALTSSSLRDEEARGLPQGHCYYSLYVRNKAHKKIYVDKSHHIKSIKSNLFCYLSPITFYMQKATLNRSSRYATIRNVTVGWKDAFSAAVVANIPLMQFVQELVKPELEWDVFETSAWGDFSHRENEIFDIIIQDKTKLPSERIQHRCLEGKWKMVLWMKERGFTFFGSELIGDKLITEDSITPCYYVDKCNSSSPILAEIRRADDINREIRAIYAQEYNNQAVEKFAIIVGAQPLSSFNKKYFSFKTFEIPSSTIALPSEEFNFKVYKEEKVPIAFHLFIQVGDDDLRELGREGVAQVRDEIMRLGKVAVCYIDISQEAPDQSRHRALAASSQACLGSDSVVILGQVPFTGFLREWGKLSLQDMHAKKAELDVCHELFEWRPVKGRKKILCTQDILAVLSGTWRPIIFYVLDDAKACYVLDNCTQKLEEVKRNKGIIRLLKEGSCFDQFAALYEHGLRIADAKFRSQDAGNELVCENLDSQAPLSEGTVMPANAGIQSFDASNDQNSTAMTDAEDGPTYLSKVVNEVPTYFLTKENSEGDNSSDGEFAEDEESEHEVSLNVEDNFTLRDFDKEGSPHTPDLSLAIENLDHQASQAMTATLEVESEEESPHILDSSSDIENLDRQASQVMMASSEAGLDGQDNLAVENDSEEELPHILDSSSDIENLDHQAPQAVTAILGADLSVQGDFVGESDSKEESPHTPGSPAHGQEKRHTSESKPMDKAEPKTDDWGLSLDPSSSPTRSIDISSQAVLSQGIAAPNSENTAPQKSSQGMRFFHGLNPSNGAGAALFFVGISLLIFGVNPAFYAIAAPFLMGGVLLSTLWGGVGVLLFIPSVVQDDWVEFVRSRAKEGKRINEWSDMDLGDLCAYLNPFRLWHDGIKMYQAAIVVVGLVLFMIILIATIGFLKGSADFGIMQLIFDFMDAALSAGFNGALSKEIISILSPIITVLAPLIITDNTRRFVSWLVDTAKNGEEMSKEEDGAARSAAESVNTAGYVQAVISQASQHKGGFVYVDDPECSTDSKNSLDC